jgi:spore germination protein KA
MIRRRLPTPDLCVETATIGRRTDTFVFICYLDSLVNKKVLKELKRRLKKIDIDGVLDSNYISELITNAPFSPLKTIGSTERPDIVAARLLEGRVAVMVDGTPVVLTLPYLFSENFQSDDDYYLNFLVASVGRILRYLCFFLALSVPAIYLALITVHKSLLPTSLAISISGARNGVPFPSVIEALLLIGIFEILRETGLRMPQNVGHALSIVGGLVIGQAAVEAKLVSAPMLIIIALSGIAGLMLPRLKGIISYGRVILVLLAHIWGLFGYLTGLCALLILIFSLNSFGIDYTSSLKQIDFQSFKDTLIRAPWRNMINRPVGISKNRIRKG